MKKLIKSTINLPNQDLDDVEVTVRPKILICVLVDIGLVGTTYYYISDLKKNNH